MQKDVENFLNYIGFNEDYQLLADFYVKKVLLITDKNIMDVTICGKEVLPFTVAENLVNTSIKASNEEVEVRLHIQYETVTPDDILEYTKELLKNLLKENLV